MSDQIIDNPCGIPICAEDMPAGNKYDYCKSCAWYEHCELWVDPPEEWEYPTEEELMEW